MSVSITERRMHELCQGWCAMDLFTELVKFAVSGYEEEAATLEVAIPGSSLTHAEEDAVALALWDSHGRLIRMVAWDTVAHCLETLCEESSATL